MPRIIQLVKFPYLPSEGDSISKHLARMVSMSQPFLQPAPHAENQESHCLLAVNIPDGTLVPGWDEAIQEVFISPPTQIRIKSSDKIVTAQIIELTQDDLAIMH